MNRGTANPDWHPGYGIAFVARMERSAIRERRLRSETTRQTEPA